MNRRVLLLELLGLGPLQVVCLLAKGQGKGKGKKDKGLCARIRTVAEATGIL